MNPKAVLTNIAVVISIMALAAAVEVFLPLFPRAKQRPGRVRANLSLMTLGFVVNWSLNSLVAIVAISLAAKPTSLLAMTNLPFAVQVIVTILILDFVYGYLAHVLLHKIPFLWRVHRVHHADPFVDVTTTSRTHPIETMWRFLLMTTAAWSLGLPAAGIVIYRLIGTTNGVLEHANIRLWLPFDRVASLIWVTPNMHKIHHSDEPTETDSNYGNILSLYDRTFGTFTSTDRAPHVVYGLRDPNGADVPSFAGLLTHPFANQLREPERPKADSEVTAQLSR